MFNLTQIKANKTYPDFEGFIINNLIEPFQLNQLVKTYPADDFLQIPQNGLAYSYETDAKNLAYLCNWRYIGPTNKNNKKLQQLAPCWQNFCLQINSSEYIASMSQLTGIDLMNKQPIVEFCTYDKNHFLEAHYDNENKKVLTQLFYFNEKWQESWGGYLNLLDSRDKTKILESIPPLANRSVILKCSEQAWHEVTQVSPQAKASRKTMQVEWYEAD